MVKLRQDGNGKYIARKRLPDDVREEYGRRYKAHHEAKFSAPASDGPHVAKQKFREWDAEVTARIEAIRAERKGEGISLTRQQSRALAGEWYHWFIARHPTTDLEQWDAVRDEVHGALREAVCLRGASGEIWGAQRGLDHTGRSQRLDTQVNYQRAIRAHREENLSQRVQNSVWMGIRT